MFKKLRNKLLLSNLAVTAALVICCLTAIYLTTYSYISRQIDGQLSRTIEMSIQRIERAQRMQNGFSSGGNQGEKPFEGSAPASGGEGNAPAFDGNRRPPDADRFSAEFSVYADSEGDVISANTNFNMVEADYADIVKSIIVSGRYEGSARLDIDSWAYKAVPYGEGYIVAFTPNSAQKKILFRLVIILILAAAVSTAITFIISLFSANRSIRPIEESYNKQKQFVADASHELRTPLASISANADVLLSKPESTIGEEKKWLIYIKDETDRMTQLTNDLLYLARSDSDKGEKILSDISFSDIVEDVILESEAVAFENNISLNYTSEPELYVSASQGGLKQLVLILMDNALKYTPENGEINIMLKSDGDKVVFSVENTGEISNEDIPHIFERFYRADKSRSRESGGYGLGLAIADSLCTGFGGTLAVKSENGRTRFSFSLDKRA
ncbi:MAG: sensor histidine kinase [Candidatus Ornithomonoglobus sp.]